MENHTEEFAGLESLGNSQVVNNIGDFLSLEELGLKKDDNSNSFLPLDNVNTPSIKNPEPDKDTFTFEDPTGAPIIPIEPIVETVIENTDDNEELKSLDEGIDVDVNLNSGVNYKSVLQDMISEGLLPGIEAFETEDGKEVSFEDMDIDKETLLALIKQNQEDIKDSIKNSSIDIDGVSDFTKKLINIEKHGGNVQQALETYQQVKFPVDTIDLNDVRGQKAMCFLRLQAQGIEDSIAKDLIKSYELQGNLEDKALESKEQLNKAFEDSIAKQEERAIKEEADYKIALKTYRSTLDNVFKDQKLPDTYRKKLLDVATKQNESGEFELDNLIENFRKNPIDAADLIMFVTNKDEFIKSKAQSLVKEEQIKTLKKVNFIPKAKSTTNTNDTPVKREESHLLDLSKL